MFIIIQSWDEDGDERNEWVDGLDIDPIHKIPTIREAQKNVFSKHDSMIPPNMNATSPIDGEPIDNPFNQLPEVNYEHKAVFKKKPLPLIGDIIDVPNEANM